MIFNHLSNILVHHDYNVAENRNSEQTLSYTWGLLRISVLTSAWGYLCVVLLVATCLGGDQPQLSLPHPHICQGGGSGAKNLDNCGELHSGNDSLYCLNQWPQQLRIYPVQKEAIYVKLAKVFLWIMWNKKGTKMYY